MQQERTKDTVAHGAGGYQAEPWRNEGNGQNDVNLQPINYPPPPTYGNTYM